MPDDPLQEIVQPFHQPFPEVLSTLRHLPHLLGGVPGKKNDSQRRKPGDDHGVGHQKRPKMEPDRIL